MKRQAIWGIAIGSAVLTAIFVTHDIGAVLSAIADLGWGAVWILAWRILSIFCSAAGWRCLFRAGERPAYLVLVQGRWIAEAINHLLPVIQIGGDVVRARLAYRAALRQGISITGTAVAAGLVADVSAALAAQVMWIACGFLQLWSRGDLGGAAAGFGMLLTAVPLAVLLIVQRREILHGATSLLNRADIGHFLQAVAAAGMEFTEQLSGLYRRRGAVARDVAWHLAASAFRIGETWSALWLLGHSVSLADAMLIDVMAGAAHSLAFLIPGGLGVEEGGILLICNLVGVAPHLALALAVMKRARDLALGLPALVTWLMLERDDLRPVLMRRVSSARNK